MSKIDIKISALKVEFKCTSTMRTHTRIYTNTYIYICIYTQT